MDDGSRLPWIIAIILVFCAAFFAIAETAMAAVSKNRIKLAAERGDSRARRGMYILENFDRAISTLLICTNIVHISAASIVTVAVTNIWGKEPGMLSRAITISTFVMTLIVFFAGEMLPKSIAKKHSEKFFLACSTVVFFFMKVFKPLALLLSAIGNFVADHTKGDPEISVTEDELYDIIEDMAEEGSIDEEQSDLISSALQFAEVTVESILTPRVDVTGIDVDDSPEEIFELIKAQKHSRLPVYRESMDDIIGVLQLRKYMKAYLSQGKYPDLMPLLDEVHYVSPATEIHELLPVLSEKKINMAVVSDRFGGTMGIITVEDILEELVGEIWDEDDEVEELFTELPDGSFVIDAEDTVRDAFEEIGFEDDIDEEDEDRFKNLILGEWALEQFTFIPKIGDEFEYHGLKVTIDSIEHNRVLKLRFEKPASTEPESEGGDEQ